MSTTAELRAELRRLEARRTTLDASVPQLQSSIETARASLGRAVADARDPKALRENVRELEDRLRETRDAIEVLERDIADRRGRLEIAARHEASAAADRATEHAAGAVAALDATLLAWLGDHFAPALADVDAAVASATKAEDVASVAGGRPRRASFHSLDDINRRAPGAFGRFNTLRELLAALTAESRTSAAAISRGNRETSPL
jgi:hypothetical protein